MAVDLSKNGAALLAAYKDVVDGKKDTNWCLFTYEGNSNVIRVSGTGDGGLEELQEELNSGKVMFAFCRVQDPNSGLPKYVLINWTGEGVKDSRKGMCANHLSSIASFLKGAHVTINARDEQDVEPELILSKVSKASGANFSFHQRDEAFRDTPREPVGSVYRKTNAVDEIQQTKKDDFWAQTQRDEELRLREEKKRTQEEKLKVEKERKEMEEKQMKELERRAKERAAQIEEERRVLNQREEEERKEEEDRQNLQDVRNERTERDWRQEAKEAKALIGQRSFNPRDAFEQRGQGERSSAPASSPGKLQSPFLSQINRTTSAVVTPQPTVSPTVSPVQPPENLYTAEEEQEEQEWSDEFDDDAADAPSEFPAQDDLYDTLPQPITSQDGLSDTLPQPIRSDHGDHGDHGDHSDHGNHYDQGDHSDHGDHGDRGVCARAVYDYQAADDTEITFDPDDIITHIDMLDEGWWRGYGPDGRYGMFPANYVEPL